MVKHFSRTKKVLRLKLGIQYRGLKVHQVCSNDDTMMTFDLFTVWSNLCPSFVAVLEEVAWHLQIRNSCFYQVSESWPMGFLFPVVMGVAFLSSGSIRRLYIVKLAKYDLYTLAQFYCLNFVSDLPIGQSVGVR